MARERHGFARIGDFGGEEIVEAPVDTVGHFSQQIDSRLQRHLAPGAFQRGLGGAHRRIDHVAVGLVDLRDDGAVDRVDLGELPGAADELPVDVALALGDLGVGVHGISAGGAGARRQAPENKGYFTKMPTPHASRRKPRNDEGPPR